MSGVKKGSRIPREWTTKFDWYDPRAILIAYRRIAEEFGLDLVPYALASMRTNKLKRYREGRQAALFCYGMAQRLQTPIYFALIEGQDFDVVAHFEQDGASHFVPIQLKEWVPQFLPGASTLQHELDKLAKYVDSEDLVVAVHLNRQDTVRLSELRIPRNIGELWFYGAKTPDQKEWTLIGNCLEELRATDFTYPSAEQ